jgi:hypothetical protein
MGLFDFFKKVGRVLRGAFAVIQKIVPEVQLVAAIELARDAAKRFIDNTDRRNYVISELMLRFPIGESVARFLVELAVQQIKHGIDKGIDAAEDAIDPA